jgi:Domain of unknown function (DUF5655)
MDNVSAEHTVDDHFTGKPPAVREVYDRLLAALRTVGPVVEEPKKTSIHLVRSSALAGVEVRKEYILLNIKSDAPIESPRVTKAERLSARRFHQKVKLSSPEEVDAELLGWLTNAYELSG